jgi:predicted GIY-YIG superfamily endonuclease
MRFFVFGPRVFGLRTGVSLGREDFARSAGQATSSAAIDPDHSFIYVVKSGNGLCKIGMTTNPNARLAQLRSGSASPLEFAWIGAPKADTIAIEREAHKMLDQYRRNGEWFAVAPDAAVGAIHSVAYRRGQPVLDLTADQAERIRQIACMPQSKSTTALGRVAVGLLQMVVAAVKFIRAQRPAAVRLALRYQIRNARRPPFARFDARKENGDLLCSSRPPRWSADHDNSARYFSAGSCPTSYRSIGRWLNVDGDAVGQVDALLRLALDERRGHHTGGAIAKIVGAGFPVVNFIAAARRCSRPGLYRARSR